MLRFEPRCICSRALYKGIYLSNKVILRVQVGKAHTTKDFSVVVRFERANQDLVESLPQVSREVLLRRFIAIVRNERESIATEPTDQTMTGGEVAYPLERKSI
jgi:hypothetical protein